MLRKATRQYGSQIAVFRAWKKEYQSNVIGLKLGSELVVVALTYPVIHEVHTNIQFDGRPDNFFLRLRTMGSRWLLLKYLLNISFISSYFIFIIDWASHALMVLYGLNNETSFHVICGGLDMGVWQWKSKFNSN